MLKFPRRRIVLLGLAVLISCILSMIFADQYLATFLTEEQYQTIYRPARELTELGVSSQFFVFCVISLVATFVLLRQKKFVIPAEQVEKLKKLQSWTVTFLYSLLASGAVVHIVKTIVGRQRPHKTESRDPLVFDFFTGNWHNHSFPSGHTQTVFTVATMLALTFPKRALWFYSAAAVIAFTRVLLHEHFFSDLIMGGYIGFTMTLLVFTYRANKAPRLVAVTK